MKDKPAVFGMLFPFLSSCLVVASTAYAAEFRLSGPAGAVCTKEAQRLGYRKIEIRGGRALGPGDIEVVMDGVYGREEVRLVCQYDARFNRARVAQVDR